MLSFGDPQSGTTYRLIDLKLVHFWSKTANFQSLRQKTHKPTRDPTAIAAPESSRKLLQTDIQQLLSYCRPTEVALRAIILYYRWRWWKLKNLGFPMILVDFQGKFPCKLHRGSDGKPTFATSTTHISELKWNFLVG